MPAKRKTAPKRKTAAKGKTTAAASSTGQGKNPASPRIRMYRVGFGDFFLMTLPSSDGPQHVLVDCGVTSGKTGKGDIASIKTAVRHMAAETQNRLALIIMTHRHADHIIGFSRCQAEFEKFAGNVGAIWMPVWENEYGNPKVKKFQADLAEMAMGLRAAALAGTQDDASQTILGIVENATGVTKEGPGGGTNARSLDLLKSRLGVTPEYYAKGDVPKLPAALTKAGLTAEILGPPPANEFDFLKMMDLKQGVGQYLDAGGGPRAKTKIAPFSRDFVVGADAYPANGFREWAPRKRGKAIDRTKRYPDTLQKAVENALPDSLLIAADTLDDYLNNQSLAVLFTWKGKKLLFAGDAQGGNWEYWLYDLDKPVKDPTQEKMTDASQSILDSIDFYKVGHHGSTNATPIAAVSAMGKDFVAMCSTQAESFGSVAHQSEVPRGPLLDALEKKPSALVRSDQLAITVDGKTIPAVPGLPTKLPTPKQGSFVPGDCYVDYFL